MSYNYLWNKQSLLRDKRQLYSLVLSHKIWQNKIGICRRSFEQLCPDSSSKRKRKDSSEVPGDLSSSLKTTGIRKDVLELYR